MIIKYNETRKRFEAITDYRTEAATANPLLKAAGFSFDFNGTKVWHTAGYKPTPRPFEQQLEIAAKLGKYADEQAAALIGADRIAAAQQAAQTKAESLNNSRATDADVEIPAPAGLAYLPYQKAGINYAANRQGTLIGDEMGLGKTIQGVGVCNMDPEAKNVLIVCPASLKRNWEREFKKWDVKGLSVGIAKGSQVPDTQVVIVNYDILDRNADALRLREWDVLIVDECHKVKNPNAKRTQFLLGKFTWDKSAKVWNTDIQPIAARRRVFLTGTPIVNRPVELWPICRALDPQGLGKYKSVFERRYCGAFHNGYGYDKSGATNLPELQEKMRSSFMVRRLKADVLKELPPKRRQAVVIEIDDPKERKRVADIVAAEQKMYSEFRAAQLTEGAKIPFERMAAARRDTAVAKIPYVIAYVTEMLEEVNKLVVMAHHHEVVDALAAAFGSEAVVIDGRTPMDDRQPAVDRFQTDPTCKVFIGSIQAAGVGLTLTAASNIVFAEIDWVPGNVAQAEDRCHRIGQVNPVLIKFLVLDQSVDADMAFTIADKQEVITQGLDTVNESKPEPAVGLPQPKPEPKPITGSPKAAPVTPALHAEQVAAIHSGLRMLAGMCDGAKERDGFGFNKLDTHFGKSLAGAAKLTEKQALAGQKLIRKYQNQLNPELVTAAGIQTKEAA